MRVLLLVTSLAAAACGQHRGASVPTAPALVQPATDCHAAATAPVPESPTEPELGMCGEEP
jgi:hypothetical protein